MPSNQTELYQSERVQSSRNPATTRTSKIHGSWKIRKFGSKTFSSKPKQIPNPNFSNFASKMDVIQRHGN